MEEQDLGVCAVSAPVFGPGGDVLAVLTLVVPSDRFGAAGRAKNTEAVKTKAAEMTAYFRSSSVADTSARQSCAADQAVPASAWPAALVLFAVDRALGGGRGLTSGASNVPN